MPSHTAASPTRWQGRETHTKSHAQRLLTRRLSRRVPATQSQQAQAPGPSHRDKQVPQQEQKRTRPANPNPSSALSIRNGQRTVGSLAHTLTLPPPAGPAAPRYNWRSRVAAGTLHPHPPASIRKTLRYIRTASLASLPRCQTR
jgi:hypothetical protein